MKYYPINETSARYAKMQNSFSDYKEGEATSEYKYYCDKIYAIVEKIEVAKPDLLEKAQSMADRYCKKLAEYYNDYYRNEASCPSVMICGPANFPTRKKERQNSRRETLHSTWEYLQGCVRKIENILTCEQPIKSGDVNAIEQLEEKITKLEQEHKNKMYWNNYYKKNGTLKGCEGLTDEQINKIESFVQRNPFFPPFIVCNDTANIRRYKQRLSHLESLKKTGITEAIVDNSLPFKVIENTDLMRLQLLFDGKPSEEIRNVLKKNGFKWSPSNEAWQRQFTENAKYSLKIIIKELHDMEIAIKED
jgi:hypothetical protein